MSKLTKNAELLVDIMNEDLFMDDPVITADLLDWLAICGFTLVEDPGNAVATYVNEVTK